MGGLENSIWSPPNASPTPAGSDHTVSRAFTLLGVVLAYLPIPVVVIVLVRLALDLVSIVESAQGDPVPVANEMSRRLMPAVVSIIVGLLGYLVAILAAGLGEFRPRWFYWALIVASAVYFFVFPVGTVLAVCAAIVLWRKRSEFAGRDSIATSG